ASRSPGGRGPRQGHEIDVAVAIDIRGVLDGERIARRGPKATVAISELHGRHVCYQLEDDVEMTISVDVGEEERVGDGVVARNLRLDKAATGPPFDDEAAVLRTAHDLRHAIAVEITERVGAFHFRRRPGHEGERTVADPVLEDQPELGVDVSEVDVVGAP